MPIHKAKKIKAWCAKNNVELCFTPTYSSWANPIGCHFGSLREFVLNNSHHVNHTVLTRRIHSYLAWRNANARDPEVLRLERKRRAEIRAEKQRRWGRPAPRAADRRPKERFLTEGPGFAAFTYGPTTARQHAWLRSAAAHRG